MLSQTSECTTFCTVSQHIIEKYRGLLHFSRKSPSQHDVPHQTSRNEQNGNALTMNTCSANCPLIITFASYMARFYYRTARIPGGAAGKITGKYEKCVFCNYFDRLFLSGEKKKQLRLLSSKNSWKVMEKCVRSILILRSSSLKFSCIYSVLSTDLIEEPHRIRNVDDVRDSCCDMICITIKCL